MASFAEFICDMYRHWVGKMTATLSIALGIVPLIFPSFFAGDNGLIRTQGCWWVASAVSFLIASRMAWGEQRKRRIEAGERVRQMEERLADKYPRLRGEIVFGYLDIGRHLEKDTLFGYPGDCVASFYLRVVNHSEQDAHTLFPPELTLKIDGRVYHGEYQIPAPHTLRVSDSELKGDNRIVDLLQFGIGGLGIGVFRKPYLHAGFLMFNLPDSQTSLEGRECIAGSATITLRDSLGGIHPITNSYVQFRIDRISGARRQ